MTDGVTVLGIRHHGPGSARSMLRVLDALEPDILLVEGPPDAQSAIPLVADPRLRPPVAVVVYPPEQPGRGSFYPFASFSPEWNALRFGLARGLPVRFCDLAQGIMLLQPREAEALPDDPIRLLAEAAGEDDPERWWERLVEQRADDADVFHAILEAMGAVREAAPPVPLGEARREAAMRQTIRQARREGYQRVAVVCGAWHAPALDHLPPARADQDLLKGLKKVKVEATWIPWTASRLAQESGYGAGVESPAWYRHLWETDGDLVAWLASAARLLRDEDLDASPAQVVETVRLTEALAALRGRPRPTLSEVGDATLAVLCHGDARRLELVRSRLVVGEDMGSLPPGVPTVPLQRDLDAHVRRLRLRLQAEERMLNLDLRQPNQLAQSQLLHRLRVLGVDWGRLQDLPDGRLGTFHEVWLLRWRPELTLQVIEAGVYGNTVLEAATRRALERGERTDDLGRLASEIELALLAALDDALAPLVARLGDRAAASTDVVQMLGTLGALAASVRYGDVRRTSTESLRRIAVAVAERAMAGLPASSGNLDDDAARRLAEALVLAAQAVYLLDRARAPTAASARADSRPLADASRPEVADDRAATDLRAEMRESEVAGDREAQELVSADDRAATGDPADTLSPEAANEREPRELVPSDDQSPPATGDRGDTGLDSDTRESEVAGERQLQALMPPVESDPLAEPPGHRPSANPEAAGEGDSDGLLAQWWRTLARVLARRDVPGLVAGTTCRLLLNAEQLSDDGAASALSQVLSPGADPAVGAAWLEGFLMLSGSGLALATSSRLFALIDAWLTTLSTDRFDQIVPLLRRATATFSTAERRQVAQRVHSGAPVLVADDADLDSRRAALVEPIVRQLLGLTP